MPEQFNTPETVLQQIRDNILQLNIKISQLAVTPMKVPSLTQNKSLIEQATGYALSGNYINSLTLSNLATAIGLNNLIDIIDERISEILSRQIDIRDVLLRILDAVATVGQYLDPASRVGRYKERLYDLILLRLDIIAQYLEQMSALIKIQSQSYSLYMRFFHKIFRGLSEKGLFGIIRGELEIFRMMLQRQVFKLFETDIHEILRTSFSQSVIHGMISPIMDKIIGQDRLANVLQENRPFYFTYGLHKVLMGLPTFFKQVVKAIYKLPSIFHKHEAAVFAKRFDLFKNFISSELDEVEESFDKAVRVNAKLFGGVISWAVNWLLAPTRFGLLVFILHKLEDSVSSIFRWLNEELAERFEIYRNYIQPVLDRINELLSPVKAIFSRIYNVFANTIILLLSIRNMVYFILTSYRTVQLDYMRIEKKQSEVRNKVLREQLTKLVDIHSPLQTIAMYVREIRDYVVRKIKPSKPERTIKEKIEEAKPKTEQVIQQTIIQAPKEVQTSIQQQQQKAESPKQRYLHAQDVKKIVDQLQQTSQDIRGATVKIQDAIKQTTIKIQQQQIRKPEVKQDRLTQTLQQILQSKQKEPESALQHAFQKLLEDQKKTPKISKLDKTATRLSKTLSNLNRIKASLDKAALDLTIWANQQQTTTGRIEKGFSSVVESLKKAWASVKAYENKLKQALIQMSKHGEVWKRAFAKTAYILLDQAEHLLFKTGQKITEYAKKLYEKEVVKKYTKAVKGLTKKFVETLRKYYDRSKKLHFILPEFQKSIQGPLLSPDIVKKSREQSKALELAKKTWHGIKNTFSGLIGLYKSVHNFFNANKEEVEKMAKNLKDDIRELQEKTHDVLIRQKRNLMSDRLAEYEKSQLSRYERFQIGIQEATTKAFKPVFSKITGFINIITAFISKIFLITSILSSIYYFFKSIDAIRTSLINFTQKLQPESLVERVEVISRGIVDIIGIIFGHVIPTILKVAGILVFKLGNFLLRTFLPKMAYKILTGIPKAIKNVVVGAVKIIISPLTAIRKILEFISYKVDEFRVQTIKTTEDLAEYQAKERKNFAETISRIVQRQISFRIGGISWSESLRQLVRLFEEGKITLTQMLQQMKEQVSPFEIRGYLSSISTDLSRHLRRQFMIAFRAIELGDTQRAEAIINEIKSAMAVLKQYLPTSQFEEIQKALIKPFKSYIEEIARNVKYTGKLTEKQIRVLSFLQKMGVDIGDLKKYLKKNTTALVKLTARLQNVQAKLNDFKKFTNNLTKLIVQKTDLVKQLPEIGRRMISGVQHAYSAAITKEYFDAVLKSANITYEQLAPILDKFLETRMIPMDLIAKLNLNEEQQQTVIDLLHLVAKNKLARESLQTLTKTYASTKKTVDNVKKIAVNTADMKNTLKSLHNLVKGIKDMIFKNNSKKQDESRQSGSATKSETTTNIFIGSASNNINVGGGARGRGVITNRPINAARMAYGGRM